jgi:hypothetical protein
MRLRLFTCAQHCIIDSNSNAATLVNLLEDISAPSLPIGIPEVGIFSLWERDEGEPDKTIKLNVRLNENQLFQTDASVAFQNTRNCRAIIMLRGLLISAPGILRFEMFDGEQLAGTWAVSVTVLISAEEKLA